MVASKVFGDGINDSFKAYEDGIRQVGGLAKHDASLAVGPGRSLTPT
jgi:hypothetical protein